MKKKRSFFGKQFKKIMLEKDINQRELADKLGIQKAMITNWISGIRNPSLNSIKKIASVLKIDYNYFIEDSEYNKQKLKTDTKDLKILQQENKILKLEKENTELKNKIKTLENKIKNKK